MQQHLDVMRDLLASGDRKTDRTGTGTISKFGGMMKFSLRHGFWPVPTTRQVEYVKIIEELEWMIKGIVDVQWLKDRNNNIWNSWVGGDGSIGPMYGEQWRNWNAGLTKDDINLELLNRIKGVDWTATSPHNLDIGERVFDFIRDLMEEKTKRYQDGGRGGVDQLQYVIDELKNNPDSRRICVSLWHAGLLPENGFLPGENVDRGKMALAPCHSMWQVNTAPMSDIEILRHLLENDDYAVNAIRKLADNGTESTALELYLDAELGSVLDARGFATPDFKIGNFIPTDLGREKAAEVRANGFSDGKQARKLSLACMARSQDTPLGTIFNVGMYSMMAHILAEMTSMVPWEYTHFMGDYHIYSNQVECVKKQLARKPKGIPRMKFNSSFEKIEDFTTDMVDVEYKAHEKIVFPRAAV